MSRRERRLASGRALYALLALAAGCGDETLGPVPAPPAPPAPEPERCAALDPDPTRFTECSLGSGAFGRWELDRAGLPSFRYTLDQAADDRALWFNTEHQPWRDHWAAFGNGRVNVLAHNGGQLELVTQDRGVEYLNKLDPAKGWFAGGFSYVDDGEEVFATAWDHRPEGAQIERRFGMGYAASELRYRGLSVARSSYAAPGDAPLLIDEVTLTNEGSETKTLRHVEVFDVARRPIDINWVVSGDPLSAVPQTARDARDQEAELFVEAVSYDAAARALVLRRTRDPSAPAPALDPPERDDHPPDPFLAALVAPVDDTFSRQLTFFGAGSLRAPEALLAAASGEGVDDGARPAGEAATLSGAGEPRMFALASTLVLAPGEVRRLRYAFGYTDQGAPLALDPALYDPRWDGLAEVRQGLAERSFLFRCDDAPELHRELAWHAAQIEASVGRRAYFEGHVVPQGSAYLYLHGADGAARDLGLFALPLTYFDPALAREELALYMRIQFAADGRFSYAFQGDGVLDDAQGIHAAPSDLDLFFLYALGEYLGATGDVGLLDARVPFWPRVPFDDATGWDHVVASLRHLFDVVGTGEHGLVRVGTGDWSDGITFEAPDRALAIEAGESVPNTQMAIAILPRVADWVRPRDAALADEIEAHVEAWRAALPSAWGDGVFGRAYFGDGELLRRDKVDLEAQVWALIGDELAPDARAGVIERVHTELDLPSPAGATLQPGGQVWPAISGLLTEGYAVSRPDLAWAHFKRNTLAAHAIAYPALWYGIWSGPDGMNGPAGDRPGEAWYSLATPMTDFPVQNNNQHAMPLYAALRLAGVRATADGLRVDPRVPAHDFDLITRLVEVRRSEAALRVVYRPTGQALRRVTLVAPSGQTITSASQDGAPVEVTGDAVTFTLLPGAQREVELAIALAP